MYICAIANQKGGVGKTTTAHNLGVQLARNAKKRVLLLDLDAQGNLSDACGLDPQTLEYTVFDVLAGNASIAEAKSTLEAGLDILPANIRLAEAELAFAGRMGRENLLKKALLSVSGEYDYVLIDCPPSLGLLTVNALNAANGLLIPVQVEYYALAGLALIRQTAELVRDLNPDLKILGLVLTFFDARKTLNKDVAAALADEWGDTLFSTRIRDNVSLAEAPSNGRMCSATSEAVTAQKTMRPLLPNFWKERRDAMGLGDRGKNQVKKGSPSGLFARKEPSITEIQASSNTQIQNTINTGIQEPLPEKNDQRKMYNISRSLSERLRKYAFDERRKEVDIVREALDDWLKKQGY